MSLSRMGISLRFPVRKPRSGFLFLRGRISDCDNLRGHRPPACPGSHESKTQGTMTNIPERPRKADPRIKGLMDALDELPEKKRALIQKRFFEGKKVEEVAKEVGLSKSAAQGRLRHAEGALRRQYRKKIRT